ncbi:arabinan endo-1,5-alpha-L-arabinosidase [Aquibacillus kalidii]|uniref:arabinan endo-1,5-alpha-L-arabinosidase n=1 Tax=Aquibacillus kalidii TaxID=2762597 RepID=UPI0016473934|nr:arabinan endo-1,5-alpha-L-arabinosidase [Aquibacillus kalidii]
MINPDIIPKDKLFDEEIIQDETKWTTNNAHDPALVKDEDTYYVFSTDAQHGGDFKAGIQIRKSKDLINWEWVGRALNGVPEEAEKWTGAKGLWAPDVTKFGDTYYLYYAASQFGSTQSFIGVATSSNIEGPYIDQGEVYKSREGEEHEPNAIDPNITIDKDGQPWMVFGSFFGGLYINKINSKTGKFVEAGKGTLIAKRHVSVERAIEGPYVVYNPDFDYYYLFVSYDSLFSNYNIRVARSKNIEGPYLDFHGNDMTNIELPPNDVGLKILGGYKFHSGDGWVAPGHNSVLKDGNNYYVCHHIRAEQDKRWHYLHIRKVVFTADGWPLVSPERFAGEEEEAIEIEKIAGDWEHFKVDKDNDSQDVAARELIAIDSEATNYWLQQSGNHYILNLASKKISGVILPSWDWEKWQHTYTFMGKDDEGVVTLAKKV